MKRLEQLDLFQTNDIEIEVDYSSFLTLKQAANLLNVSWQTVRNYIKNGEIKAIKLNGERDYRINPIDLAEFIKAKLVNHHSKEESQEQAETNIDQLLMNSKNTKNSTLFYKNKSDMKTLLDSIPEATLECIEKTHDGYDNSIYHGDNLYIMKTLLSKLRGQVDLIYIDPPFGTNQDFIAYDGKTGYSDKITNDEFLEFLRQRLVLLKEFLSEQGSIYVHIDKKMSHYVKIIMDEVFGEKNFINEITRIKSNPKNFARKAYGNYTDTILFYSKVRDQNIWNDITIPLTKKEIEELFPKIDANGRRYTTHPLHAPGVTKDGPTGEMWNGMMPPEGRHWRYTPDVLDELLKNNRIEWSDTGNPRKIVYADEHKGKKPQDIWEFKDKGMKYSTYPTEKNQDMLKFIIENSSKEGSLVLDCFAGSFSTLVQAAKLNRRFIGIDAVEDAINIGKANLDKAKIPYNFYKAID